MAIIRKTYSHSDKYKYTITLFDHEKHFVREFALENIFDYQIARHAAQGMLADYMEDHAADFVRIKGPGSTKLICQEPGFDDPYEMDVRRVYYGEMLYNRLVSH